VNSPVASPVTVEQALLSATATGDEPSTAADAQPGQGRRSRPGIGFQDAPDR
jgi:hypothetical protein